MISRQQSSCSSFLIKRNSTPAASISQTTLEANSDTNSSHVEQEVVQTVTFHASKFSWGLTGWNGESGWQWLSPGISQDASGADYRHCHRSILKVSTTIETTLNSWVLMLILILMLLVCAAWRKTSMRLQPFSRFHRSPGSMLKKCSEMFTFFRLFYDAKWHLLQQP